MKTNKRPIPSVKKSYVVPDKKSVMAMSATDEIMLFYGPPGVGKTKFVMDMVDRVAFLSTDRGTRHKPAFRMECQSLDDVLGYLIALRGKKFDFVCIDHLDDISTWAANDACKELGISSLSEAEWGAGWAALERRLAAVMIELKKLDCGIVFICHEVTKTIRARGIEREVVMPDLGKKAWKLIVPLCTIVGYCGFKRIKTAKGMKEVRVLQTDPEESIYAKDRSSRKRTPGQTELLDGRAFFQSFPNQA